MVFVSPCGVTTHTEITHRALQSYDSVAFGDGVVRKILMDRPGSLEVEARSSVSHCN